MTNTQYIIILGQRLIWATSVGSVWIRMIVVGKINKLLDFTSLAVCLFLTWQKWPLALLSFIQASSRLSIPDLTSSSIFPPSSPQPLKTFPWCSWIQCLFFIAIALDKVSLDFLTLVKFSLTHSCNSTLRWTYWQNSILPSLKT